MPRLNSAKKRYNRRALLASLGYMVTLIGVSLYFKNHPDARGVTAYAAAVLPAFPILVIFAAIGRYIVEETDEYQRMLLIRQSLVASGFALSIATVWGFLESFGLVHHLDAYWVAVLWFGGLGVGTCVNKLLERRA